MRRHKARFLFLFIIAITIIAWASYEEWKSKFDYDGDAKQSRSTKIEAVIWTGAPTITNWVPYVIIWIVSCFHVPYLYLRQTTSKNHLYGLVYRIRSILVVLLTAVVFAENISGYTAYGRTNSTLICAVVNLSSAILLLSITFSEERKGVHPSPVPFVGAFFLLAAEFSFSRVVILYADLDDIKDDNFLQMTVFRKLRIFLLITVTIWSFIFDMITPTNVFLSNDTSAYRNKKTNPFNRTSLISRCSLAFIFRPMLLITHRRMDVDDLFDFEPGHDCKSSIEEIDRLTRNRSGAKSSELVRSGLSLVIHPLLIFATSRLFVLVIRIYNYTNLGAIITFLSSSSNNTWVGVMYCIRTGLARMTSSMFRTTHLYTTHYAAARVRGIVTALVMRKYFRLSPEARKRIGNEVVSHISVDAQRVGDMFSECNVGYELILYLPLSTWVIWQQIGSVALLGIGMISLTICSNTLILKRIITRIKLKEVLEKSARLKLLGTFLHNVQVLKLMAWEGAFEKNLNAFRDKELSFLRQSRIFEAVSNISYGLAPTIASALMICVYVLISEEHEITAEKVFVSMLTLDGISFFAVHGPITVSYFVQGLVSLKRLRKFMDESEELQPAITDIGSPHIINYGNERRHDVGTIELKDASFSWFESDSVLDSLNIRIDQGELVIVVGLVGSGKSSLLSALLGEMYRQSGLSSVSGRIAYAPQEPWIMNATVQENITFGTPYNQSRLEAVMGACALNYDVDTFKGGILTEIGEQGVTLSGGQRHRISLARTLYNDADLYLLDDILSAVDTNVASHIFSEAIGPKSLLKNKTRILVTHSLHWLPYADRIVVLERGRIVEMGSFSELTGSGRFLKEHEQALSKAYVKNDVSPSNNEHIRNSADPSETSKLMSDEATDHGQTLTKSILTLCHYMGFRRCLLISFFLAINVVSQASITVWIGFWGNEWAKDRDVSRKNNVHNLGIFLLLGLNQIFLRGLILALTTLSSLAVSKILHESLISRVLRATMNFFNRTPSGRILNWFSRDLDIVDISLPKKLAGFSGFMPDVCSTLGLILWKLPGTLILIMIQTIASYKVVAIQSRYAREVARIEGATRSPLFSFLNETVQGIVSIRAYRRQTEYCEKFFSLVDRSNRPSWHYAASINFLRVSKECIGSVLVIPITIACVVFRQDIHPAISAGIIYGCFKLTSKIVYVGLSISDLGTTLIAIDRITSHNNIDNEGNRNTTLVKLDKDWPPHGAISFIGYSAKYDESLPFALRDVSFSIRPGEKIGVVGRTGAGKTSLILALMRILEPSSGSIIIDGIDISKVGLHDLRTKITVITQEPVLSGGSVREKLDPFGEYTDSQLWEALEYAYLKECIAEKLDGLGYSCGEIGELLSVGQRQQLCLARALLRKTRILVLDEPTAAVDVYTDKLVQKSLRQHFNHCTIITIAHRINTIIDYDRIMVIQDSKLVEFDTPANLVASTSSFFSKLCKDLP